MTQNDSPLYKKSSRKIFATFFCCFHLVDFVTLQNKKKLYKCIIFLHFYLISSEMIECFKKCNTKYFYETKQK